MSTQNFSSKRTVAIALGSEKAVIVDATKWSSAEIRQCLDDVKRMSFSPGQRAIDKLVEEYNRRHPKESTTIIPPDLGPMDEVATYREAPRAVTPEVTPERKTFWRKVLDLWQQFKALVVRVFE